MKLDRIVAGALALISCYAFPIDLPSHAYAYSPASDSPTAQPVKTPEKKDGKYEGFYFGIWDYANQAEVGENVVIRVMPPDGNDQVIELNVDGGHYVQMNSYAEEPTETQPPAMKHFDLEIAVDYLPRGSDGTPRTPAYWANTVSMDIPYGANFIVTLEKDGSFSLKPLPKKKSD